MMAALPYMQLYVADYLADTSHLTTEEHGAYLLLLFSYWQTGKPLRIDRLSTVARISNDRWPPVEDTLSEFFHVTPTHWVQFRVEADLESVNSKVVTASNAGKASARAKALKKQQEVNDRSTTVADPLQPEANHKDTDTDTDTEEDQHNTHSAGEANLVSEPELKPTAENSSVVEPEFEPELPPLPVDPLLPSEMSLEWEPDHGVLTAYAKVSMVPLDAFTPDATGAFVCHYSASGRFETQAKWVQLLVAWVKRDLVSGAARSNVRPFPVKRQANGPDFNDTTWSDDLGDL